MAWAWWLNCQGSTGRLQASAGGSPPDRLKRIAHGYSQKKKGNNHCYLSPE